MFKFLWKKIKLYWESIGANSNLMNSKAICKKLGNSQKVMTVARITPLNKLKLAVDT
jgi:hypothetical protein